jgi:UDP-N-acetylmuramate dehydrogenase
MMRMSALPDRAALVALVKPVAAKLGVACRFDEPLGPHTTMGVGGPAPCFLEPRSAAELAGLLRELTAAAIPFRILGAGSNIIVDDAGVKTAVVSTSALTGEPVRSGETVRAEAGVLLPRLVRLMAAEGLGGFEFLEGIPGSVGGAIFMNAGAGGRWIGDVASEVEVLTPGGELARRHPEKKDFGYRRSFVSDAGLIVCAATLRGTPDDPEAIRERIRDSRAYRTATQPLAERSSGCVFKNPAGDSAGALLDRLALKGTAVGGAVVSDRHANFIVNRGGTGEDILRLVDLVRERVRRETGVELALEVVVWRDR